jgi:hypothetical protein
MCFGCLFAAFAATFPRLGLLFVWAFTDWVEDAFDGWFVPLLGLIFLPLATLTYVFVDLASRPGDINLGGWLVVGLAVLFDLSHWAQIAANRRNAELMYAQYGPGGTPPS